MPSARLNVDPPGWIESLFRSLSLSLFLWLAGVIIVTFAAYASISIGSTSRQWNRSVRQGADQYSELIQNSAHYSMLLNRKEDVHQIIRTVAETPGVESVRIYDKAGVIIYSAAESEIGRRVDLQAEACVSCHSSDRPLEVVPEGERSRIYWRADGVRVLGLINPIENTPECSNAACHAHSPAQSVLGVLDVTMSMAGPDARLAAARRQALVGALVTALLAGFFSMLFLVRVVRRPVNKLIAGANRVARGELDTEIRVESRNEIGQLAVAFNTMTRDLSQARRELTDWSGRLEVRLQEKTAELGETQRHVAHMDKMASLGKLAATVAHELNNPLAGILNYAKLVERTVREGGSPAEEREELDRYLKLIQQEATRSGTIVRNLLAFARRGGVEFALHPVGPILERSAMLVRHHMEMANISLDMEEVADDLMLVCDANQIQQATVALLVNAVEAMPRGGTVRLAAGVTDGDVVIEVEDTGVGILPEALPHIFEPFYSSKDDAHGAGLGLAVVFGIIQRHGGRIDVDSEPERGTCFRLLLPREPRQPVASEDAAPAAMKGAT